MKKTIRFIELLLLVLLLCTSCKNKPAPSTPTDATEPTVKEVINYASFNEADPFSHIKNASCVYENDNDCLFYNCEFKSVPKSDDEYVYLFAFDSYENSQDYTKESFFKVEKGNSISIQIPYTNKLLFYEYVPAIKYKGSMTPIYEGVFISNPESISADKELDSTSPDSKKGILIDPTTLNTPMLDDLNIKHAVYNLPLSYFIATESTDESPSIAFDYNDKRYYFNEKSVLSFDALFTTLNEKNICITAIVLNDWDGQEATQLLVDPASRKKNKNIFYYQFNTQEQDATDLLQATALFLSNRYSTTEHGIVQNWVIGNEINQHKFWNYMETDDLDTYVSSFEKSFRIFYNSIKSYNKNANVYFSIDHDWNSNGGDNTEFFNGKDIIQTFNSYAQKTNYDWCVAIHPYPVPLTKVNYWSQKYDITENAPALTVMNLNTITEFLSNDEYKNTSNEVRKIAITELGYTSSTGEMLQAAAFAYCYKIVDSNPYIDMFLLNRQIDCIEEMKSGLFLGIYNIDNSPKYSKEVFSHIDEKNNTDYDELILNIIGASSMEEALSWANPQN